MAEDVITGKSVGLVLVGIGPGAVSSMSLEALETAKSADLRRFEAYTALWPEDELRSLERIVGPIERVMRPEVENPKEF